MTRGEAARILGVSPDAGESRIKKAFRTKAMKLHPDRNRAPDARSQFIELHEAYEYLLDVLQGKTPKSYSTSDNARRTAKTSNKFRGEGYRQRNYRRYDPYADMSREEFERRYQQARKAAEAEFERRSERAYQQAFDEYRYSWRRKFAKWMAGIGLVLALLFTIDYFAGTVDEVIPHGKIELFSINDGTYVFDYLSINHVIYSIRNDKFLSKPGTKYTIRRTKIFKDILWVRISDGKNYIVLEPSFSSYRSFPLVPFILLIPLLTFLIERPTFNFVFLAVHFNIYVFPLFVFVLMAHDGRILRLFGL
jgi:hypothetical protein